MHFIAVASLLLIGSVSALGAQIPTNQRPLHNGDGVFRFAILADRTARPRPGVFEDGVTKVIQMQPEFVMSIGDLIGGYSQDPAKVREQWDEMEAIINRMSMRFYYVPGNHDIGNPVMLDIWKERRGDPYYSFIHEHVLFLILHTEEIRRGGIGEEQIAFARRTLAEHADVRWTLVFMHRPLWFYPERRGYEQIEAALAGRRYTVFSGHHHQYLKCERQGMVHYILATTGGMSALRGKEYGEFDHITWVTMNQDGPAVVNLELSGIVPDDITTEWVEPKVETAPATTSAAP